MENGNEEDTKNNVRSNEENDVIFYFYYDLVKRMILKRQDVEYICTLSSWLKALENNKNMTLRNDYVKLMVLLLQNADPLCPFKDYPPELIDPLKMGVIETARKLRQGDGTPACIGNNETKAEYFYPTISTAVSPDKRQYAACQVIPNVGVQCYYAFSDDHLYNWNIPLAISVPLKGPHTRDIDWERAMAGINLKHQNNPSEDNLELENTKNVKFDIENDGAETSGNGSLKKMAKENDEADICKVMFIEQQVRGVTEVFEWNDASLLTGEIILGAEMGSDRKVDAQIKTQPELDKEVGSCYDKLYPGDFRVQVTPSFLSDIIQQNTCVDTETGEKVKDQQFDESKKMSDGNKTPSNACRQRAGHEDITIIPSVEDLYCVNESKVDPRQKISEISADLAALNYSYKSRQVKNRKCVEPIVTCPQTSAAGQDIMDTILNNNRNNRAIDYGNNYEERPTDSKLHTDLLDFQRQIKMAEDCRNNVQRSLLGNNNCKNIDHCDTNETMSDE